MIIRYTLRAALLASTCVLPFAAQAQDLDLGGPAEEQAAPSYSNEVEVGGQWQSENSYKFGRFTGATDKGGYSIGGFTILGRDPWDSGKTQYWEAEGSNLGFDSRSVSARYGFLGSWGLRVFYDGIPYNDSETFHTIYDTSGKGTINGGTPSSSVFTSDPNYRTSAAGLNNGWTLAPDLLGQVTTQGTHTKRDIVGGQANFNINAYWTAAVGLTHEHKDGIRENSLMFGGATHLNTYRYCIAGSAGAVSGCSAPTSTNVADTLAFPQPVDYDTTRYDAKMAFTAPRLQAEFGYTFSDFTDNNTSFNAIDPFPFVGAAAAGNLPSGTVQAAYALPPSSSEHQVHGSLGYDLLPSTRINANLSYAMQLQNDTLAANSNNSNPGYSAASLANLARNPGGADAKQQNIFGNVAVISRPLPKLDIRASYTIDDRRDMTSTNLWWYSSRDATLAALSSATNNPLSFQKNTAKAEAGYRVLRSTKVTLGYTFEQKNTNEALFVQSRENSVWGKVKSQLSQGVESTLGYTHSVRYMQGTYNQFGSSNAYGTIPFFEAPRTRDQVKGDLSVEARHDTFIGLNAKFTNDHYPLSVYPNTATYQVAEGSGLRNSHDLVVGPDLTFTPGKNVSTHLFYNYQRIFKDTRDVSSLVPTAATAFGSTPYFKNQVTDDTHTVGLSADWQATPKLKLSASYNFSYGDTTYNISDGVTLAYLQSSTGNYNYTIVDLPDTTSQLHSLSVRGEYKFKPNMSLFVGYQFERFIYNDVAYTIPITGYDFGNALTPGQYNPSYSVHVIGAAIRVKF